MDIQEAQSIVERYQSAEIEVDREFQERVSDAFRAMQTSPEHGPDTATAQVYGALMIEKVQVFRARVADIYDAYIPAYVAIDMAKSAEHQAQGAAAINLALDIAYGDGD